ncbi:MAG: hypothetical protein M3Z66_19865 [Chloroflexota bacterium]|nr:hypothetical protein [Chloroflexota bacterium]
MNRLNRTLALAALAAVVPLGAAHAAPVASPNHAVLHVVTPYKGRTPFMHVMASAKLKQISGHDIKVTLTTDNLPKASTFGKRVFVLFASDGAMTDRVGALTAHGAMAGTSGVVMMSKIQDLYVYAEGSPAAKHPGKGVEVLAGMIG